MKSMFYELFSIYKTRLLIISLILFDLIAIIYFFQTTNFLQFSWLKRENQAKSESLNKNQYNQETSPQEMKSVPYSVVTISEEIITLTPTPANSNNVSNESTSVTITSE